MIDVLPCKSAGLPDLQVSSQRLNPRTHVRETRHLAEGLGRRITVASCPSVPEIFLRQYTSANERADNAEISTRKLLKHIGRKGW